MENCKFNIIEKEKAIAKLVNYLADYCIENSTTLEMLDLALKEIEELYYMDALIKKAPND